MYIFVCLYFFVLLPGNNGLGMPMLSWYPLAKAASSGLPENMSKRNSTRKICLNSNPISQAAAQS